MHSALAGFFAFAAIHSAIFWWLSRKERVLLVFSVQCAVYAVFCILITAYFRATTIPGMQAASGRCVGLGVIAHALVLLFYAEVGARRDRAFRALVTGVIGFLAVLNLWAPLRGTIVAVTAMQLSGGGKGWVPIRTAPGASLVLMYLAEAAVQCYGFFVARAIWKRDRTGAVLVAVGSAAALTGVAVAFFIDFAKLRAPYLGASPHAVFVVCVALFLAREYSARGARLVATERRFEAAFEHGPSGKALLAPDGRFLKVNLALCRLLGWTAEELCARRFVDITPEDDGGSEEEAFGRLREVTAYTIEKRLIRKDGTPVWGLLSVARLPDDLHRPVRIIVQVHDMTELRAHRERLEELIATRTSELHAAKDEAERANQGKSRFLAHMSHETRNPLHVILMYVQILLDDPSLGEEQRKMIGVVGKSGLGLLALINEVLEMSKLEAREPELVEDPFDPGTTLDEVAGMFTAEAESKTIELAVECAPELPHALVGDGAKVKQIVINLASNALKFTKQGSIRFRASSDVRADGAILVKIVAADTGIGIGARDAARMFQPFEQLDAGKRAGGTGLGLAISRAYARRMGGDLTVDSIPDVGSTFTFTFVAKPVRSQAASAIRGAPAHVVVGTIPRKVLIIDDLAVNRDALSTLFLAPAFETRTAADGATALSISADWHPDLVLVDLRLPEMNGFEVIQRMRAAGSGAAIGALTASIVADDERQALASGADFFMRKPFDNRGLLDRIAQVHGAAPGAHETASSSPRSVVWSGRGELPQS
jgi:PAS domain S-box-containing protein